MEKDRLTIPDDLIIAAKESREKAENIWARVQRLCFWFVKRYASAAELNTAVDFDDLKQCAAVACLQTIQTYEPCADYSFITALIFAVRNECSEALGFRGRTREEFYLKIPGDAPKYEDSDESLLNTIPGETFADPEEAAFLAVLREAVRGAVDDLPEEERICISSIYFKEKTKAQTAAALKCNERRVSTIEKNALSRLSRCKHRLREFLPNYYRGTGLQPFLNTQTSAVEWAVIKKEDRGFL